MLGFLVCLEKLFAGNSRLSANSPECGSFYLGMIGHGQWNPSPIRILFHHCDVFSLAYEPKASRCNALITRALGASTGNLATTARLWLLPRMPQGLGNLTRQLLYQKSQHGI